jgi:hypothetical protein
MDDDVVPIAATDAFVRAEGDIIGAKAIAKTGSEMLVLLKRKGSSCCKQMGAT